MYFWVSFDARKSASISANSAEHAKALAAEITGDKVKEVFTLPYPAAQRLNQTSCPDFCFSPETCKGRTSCPKSYACSE
jgi:hypothetical protein